MQHVFIYLLTLNASSLFLVGSLGFEYLGQKGPSDEDFHEHGDDQLEDEEDYGGWAFLGDAAETITDGRL